MWSCGLAGITCARPPAPCDPPSLHSPEAYLSTCRSRTTKISAAHATMLAARRNSCCSSIGGGRPRAAVCPALSLDPCSEATGQRSAYGERHTVAGEGEGCTAPRCLASTTRSPPLQAHAVVEIHLKTSSRCNCKLLKFSYLVVPNM